MNKSKILMGASTLLMLSLVIISLSVGSTQVPADQTFRILISRVIPIKITWTSSMYNVIMNIRLPRVLGSLLVGGALAVSGTIYQGIFQNLLVSPDILGVSSGACVGAAIGIIMNSQLWAIPLLAFLGGLLAVVIAMFIPKLFKNRSTLMLVLSGVIVSGLMNSLLGLLKYMADPEDQLASIVFWTMGSFSTMRLDQLAVMTIPIIIGMGVAVALRWRINLLALGDKEAQTLGVNVHKLRKILIVVATILTATAVSMSGTIGWIGLIIPHFSRLLVGQDNRFVIPSSIIFGCTFLIFVDTLARNLSYSEIPIGILTGIIGAPLFVLFILKQHVKLA